LVFGLLAGLLSLAPRLAAPAALTVADDRGQVVRLPGPPQRIISLAGGLTDILAALGVADRLVGRIQGDRTVEGVPTVGTHLQPNVEMILALKPDLVVQGWVAKGLPALARLTAEGVAVALFDPRDFAGLFATIRRLGTLTGRETAAQALVAQLEARLGRVAREVEGKPRPTVFFEVRYPNLLGAGRGSLVNDIITRAGGENVLTHPQKLVPFSLEALLALNPQVYVIQRGPMNKSPQDIHTRPNFQELTAVKQGRVLMVEEEMFSRPGPRAVAAVELLARYLHGGGAGEEAP
jgi:iron complex transport system substrate-binding protein